MSYLAAQQAWRPPGSRKELRTSAKNSTPSSPGGKHFTANLLTNAQRARWIVRDTLDKSERLLSIYSLLNRIRLCASDAVLAAAEGALAAIAEQYFRPNLTLEQLRALIRDGANTDPLKSFAEACRAELKSMHAAL